MNSQPNHEARFKTPRVTLTEHGLSIDAAATFSAVYGAFTITGSLALATLFASSPEMECSIEPAAPDDRRVCAGRRLESLAPSHVAAAAAALGYETGIQRVWADQVGATFASGPRLIEAMRVDSGFTYTRAAPARSGTGAIISRGEVAAGSYLIFSVGLGAPTVRCVARVEQIPTAETLAAIDGFAADCITAACGRCQRRWTAREGRPLFSPTYPDGIEWDLGQATGLGFVTSTVDCPAAGCPGRVGFASEGGKA